MHKVWIYMKQKWVLKKEMKLDVLADTNEQ